MKLRTWLKNVLFEPQRRFQTVSMTLRPGARMEAGELVVRPTPDGDVLVSIGRDLAVAIAPMPGRAELQVRCYAAGVRLPVLVDSGADAPLLRLGPGGDYAVDRHTDQIGGDEPAGEVATA